MNGRTDLRRVAANFVALALVRGFAVLGPLIVMPYLVKTIGIANWGSISFALAAAAFAGPVVMYGFGISATAALARNRGKEDVRIIWEDHFAASAWLAIGVSAACCVTLVCLNVDTHMATLVLTAVTLTIATALVPVWLFMGLERMQALVISNALNRVGYVLLVILLVQTPDDTVLVLLLGALASVVGLVFALVWAWRSLGLGPTLIISPTRLVRILSSGAPTFALLFVPLLYNAGGIFLLGLTSGKATVGLFAIAATIVEAALTGGRLLSNAALPLVAVNKERQWALSFIGIAIGSLLALSVALAAPFISAKLAPDHYSDVRDVLWILSASIPFAFAQLAFNQNGLAINGHEYLASKIVVVISLAGGMIGLWLVPEFGPVGAAATILICRTMLGISSFVGYYKTSIYPSVEMNS